jgi:hypothetical protein
MKVRPLDTMKRFLTLFAVALSTSIFGGFIGYYIAKRSQPPLAGDYYLLHEGLERQAGVYMRFLQAQDSAQPEQMMHLRRQALATFRVYVDEVADMQALGFQWSPIDRQLHTFVVAYLAQHSKEK